MDEVNEQQLLSAVQNRSRNVKNLINQRNLKEAVMASLEDPPIFSKSQSTKDVNAETVLNALTSCSKTDIKSTIEALTPELEDNLMKYLYRIIAIPQNNATFFEWHGQLVEKAGVGCIVRALTDRKVV